MTVRGLYTQAEGKNAKPAVIPEIQEWYSDSAGRLPAANVTGVTYDDAALKTVVEEFVADYEDFTGITNATFALPLARIGSGSNAIAAVIDNVTVTRIADPADDSRDIPVEVLTATAGEKAAAHEHVHEAVVTAPTCTEGGYTTYTCACGDSYTADETEALGHEWKGTGCTRCGEKRENPFTDVPEDSFYIDPILWAVEEGITTGTSATTFDPNGACMRAVVVTFLWRAKGCPEPTTNNNPFTDVKETDFYYKAVLWALENEITNGISATEFGVGGICNRAQVVTFLYRALAE